MKKIKGADTATATAKGDTLKDIKFCGAQYVAEGMIPLNDIAESQPISQRTDANNPEILDLAKSIKTLGQLVPVIIRETPDSAKPWALIAGHRRLAACRLAGLEDINAITVAATDEQAEMIAIAENLKRENLTPLEEAAAIKKLLDTGMDRKSAGAVLGWPESKVTRRAKLIDLSDEWREAISGKIPDKIELDSYRRKSVINLFAHWTVGHLELIARYDKETQFTLLQGLYKNYHTDDMTVKDLEAELIEVNHQLKKAPWKLDDDTLVPKAGACNTCPKRSANNPGLFDDDLTPEKITADDKCIDPKCWQSKLQAHAKRKEEELRAEHPDMVKIRDAYSDKDGCLGQENYDYVKKGTAGARLAIIEEGENLGKTTWVKLRKDASQKTSSRSNDASQKPKPASKAVRYARLADRRNAHIVEAIRDMFREKNAPGKKLFIIPPGETHKVKYHLAVIIAFGTSQNRGDLFTNRKVWESLANLSQADGAELFQGVVEQIAPVLCTRLNFSTGEDATKKIPEAKSVCALLGIDFEALQKKAEADIPVPKSWGKLDTPEKPPKPAKPATNPPKKATQGKVESKDSSEEQTCRYCGCSETSPCILDDEEPCSWVKPDVCSNPECVAKSNAKEKDGPKIKKCPKCGQVDRGQTGEYPCPECGLPSVWDAKSAKKYEPPKVTVARKKKVKRMSLLKKK
jgi:ParB/RepB/Spo0J family partition protein